MKHFTKNALVSALAFFMLIGTINAQNRNISGGVTADPTVYTAGTTVDLELTWDVESADLEYVNSTKVIFPAGVTINSATNIEGENSLGTIKTLPYDAVNSTAQMAIWEKTTTYGMSESYFPNSNIVNVTIAADFVGVLTIEFSIYGDEDGAEPHLIVGTMELDVDNSPATAAVVVAPASTVADPFFTLTWDAAPVGADSYKVYRDAGEGYVELTTATALTYDDHAIVEGISYKYAVAAVLAGVESLKVETEAIELFLEATMTIDPETYTFSDAGILELDGTVIYPAANASFTIENLGVGALTINDIYFFSMNSAEFDVVTTATFPVVLGLNETFTFEVAFNPTSVTQKATLLTVDAGVISTYEIFAGAYSIFNGDIVEDPIALGTFSEPVGDLPVVTDFSVFYNDYDLGTGVDAVYTLTTVVPADITVTSTNVDDFRIFNAGATLTDGNELNITNELLGGDYVIIVTGAGDVEFNIHFESEAVFVITPESLDLGDVPINAWHRGGSFVVSNDGGYSYNLDSHTLSDVNGVYEIKTNVSDYPFEVAYNTTATYTFELDADTEGTYDASLLLEDAITTRVFPVTGFAYDAPVGDIVENPYLVSFDAAGAYADAASLAFPMRNNYAEFGATTRDVVYKFQLDTDMLVDFTLTTGFELSLFAAADLVNSAPVNVTPVLTEADVLSDVELNPGVYFLVITGENATPDYELNLQVDVMPVPADFSQLTPADETIDVSLTPTLTWEDAQYAQSYTLYLGTTYPPALFASDITATEFTIDADLFASNVYFWKVVANNTTGTTETGIWGFTTEIPSPNNVTATIQNYDDVLVTWQSPFEDKFVVNEDFEGDVFPPTGWDMTSNSVAASGGWYATASGGSQYFSIPDHTVYARTNDDTANDDGSVDYLWMPATDFTGYDAADLSFASYFTGGYGTTAHVLITNDGGTTFEEVLALEVGTAWEEIEIDLLPYTNGDWTTAQIVFHSNDNGDWASGWAIDDVNFELVNNVGTAAGAVLGYNIFQNDVQINTELAPGFTYLVESLPAGTYEFCVSAVFPEGESDKECALEVTILGRSDITGTVYNADGGVIEGATIEIVGDGYTATATTNAAGLYEFLDIPVLVGGYDATCTATGWEAASADDLIIAEGAPVVQDFTLGDIALAASNVVAEVVTSDENHIYWSGWDEGQLYEISHHSGAPGNAFIQAFDKAYGVVYDLTAYTDAKISMIDFHHSSYGVTGIWDYKIHIINWDTYEVIDVLGPFQTTGDDVWETEVALGDIIGLGGVKVGIFMEPLSNDAADAYPDLSTDNDDLVSQSGICTVGDWAGFAESTAGDFLMDLWIITAQGSEPVMATKVDATGNTNNAVTKAATSVVNNDFIIVNPTVSAAAQSRAFDTYTVSVLAVGEEGNTAAWKPVGTTTTTEINDITTWETLEQGAYRYAVVATYTQNESAPAFSNVIGKDMRFDAVVTVETNTGVSAEHAIVTFTNNDSGDVYTANVTNLGYASFYELWKGNYTITVSFTGYDTFTLDKFIWDDDYYILDVILIEALCPASSLTASVECSDVTLNWSAPADCNEVESYSIKRNGNLVAEDLTETTFVDADLFGGPYDYEVIAKYSTGYAAPVTVTVEVASINAPMNLTATTESWNNVILSWEMPSEGYMSANMALHNGVFESSVGYNGPGDFDAAARYTTELLAGYDGLYLTKISFYPAEADCEYSIRVWTGDNAANMIVDQLVPNVVLDEINTVELDTPVLIDASQELWMGFRNNAGAGYPAGADSGPANVGFGDMMWDAETGWISMATEYGIDRNWLITGLAETDNGAPVAMNPISDVDRTASTSTLATSGIVENSGQMFTPEMEEDMIGFTITREHDVTGEVVTLAEYYQGLSYVDFDIPVVVEQSNLFTYTVTAVYSGACEASAEVDVLFGEAVNPTVDAGLNVYPNPATSYVNIELPANVETIKVLNTVGQIVYQAVVTGENLHTIATDNYSMGAYVIQVITNDGNVMNQKVVITK